MYNVIPVITKHAWHEKTYNKYIKSYINFTQCKAATISCYLTKLLVEANQIFKNLQNMQAQKTAEEQHFVHLYLGFKRRTDLFSSVSLNKAKCQYVLIYYCHLDFQYNNSGAISRYGNSVWAFCMGHLCLGTTVSSHNPKLCSQVNWKC